MKLVSGVGVNDLKGESRTKFYQTWNSMLDRCYSKKSHLKYPTYIGCSVYEDWLTFSNFKSWMVTQDFEGKQLDKDILFPGNKVYSPETCVFISQELNKFLLESNKIRGELPIGVYLDKQSGKFVAHCGENGTLKYLGRFDTPEEAHNAWLSKKLELAIEFSKHQIDLRVARAIIEKYKNYHHKEE